MRIYSRLFTLFSVAAMALPFNAMAAPDSGLLVTHVTLTKWQAKLIAGPSAPQVFTGSVSSSRGVTLIVRNQLEGTDVAKVNSENGLTVSFSTPARSTDGVSFWTPQTSQMCLSNTGGTAIKVYLGATMADAVEISLPYNLQGEDPCGIKPPPTPYQTNRKFHPGHYTALLASQGALKYMQDTIRPGNTGLLKRYSWRNLEPTRGSYDFAGIAADLVWAQSYGQQLIIMIEDKTFGTPESPAPDYLASYMRKNSGGGYTMARWDPTVVTRWKALVQAMGARFDANPNFEGIATQETALSLNPTMRRELGFTAEKYRDSYIETLSSALVSMPTSRVFWYQNFFVGNQSYISAIAKIVGPKGVVLSGPDDQPDNMSLVNGAYPNFAQFKGQMHMAIQVEGMCYNSLHATHSATKYWTPAELFTFAQKTLNVNYMIWVRIPVSSPADSYNWHDALPVIEANPTVGPTF